MASIIETIKARVDVVEEIGLVVALKKSGKSFKGLCPFHNERTPSFYVFAETQTWRCFGCNEGGDIFTFVQKQQGLEFREALQYLAEKAGIAVEEYGAPRTEEEREASSARERLRQLNEEALLWFHQALLRSKEAAGARAYIQSRGISADSVQTFALGYALDQWDALTKYLLGRGYSERELVMAGLAREREAQEDGQRVGVYDYFRNRLIFPIRDIRGRVIGFGGRALGDWKPKYLNSPQTLLFEKNTVLYAIDLAKDAIKQAGQVIIVEGYVDALIAHQYGTKQTVACIGSAITEKHIQQLKKLTRQVTLALDPDAAGSAATEQGIAEALRTFDRTVVPVPLPAGKSAGRGRQSTLQPRVMIRLEEQVDAEINVLQLPAGQDPDEVIRNDLSTWLYAVAHPLPLVDYYFVVKTADLNLKDPTGKTEAARRLLPVIGTIGNRIKRDAYIRKLAAMISTDERTLYAELQRTLKGQSMAGVLAQFSEPSVRQAVNTRAEKSNSSLRHVAGIVSEESGEAPVQRPAGEHQPEKETVGLDRGKHWKIQWEDYLIGLLLCDPAVGQHVYGIISDGDFAGTDTRELYRILNSIGQRDSSPSRQSLEQLVPAALLETIARARKCVESSSPKDGEGLVREAVQCATRLKRMRLLQLNTELEYLIREAADSGDKVLERQLRQQVFENRKLLRTLYTSTHLHG
ncbi:MAG: DNA primase [Ktedonobacteraceae bacterium]|nr:DNA primase [Ktedonobacteraceae bacterium]